MKNEIKRQNCNFDKQINEINARYENIQGQVVEAVSEKFDTKINNLYDKISIVNDTVIEKIQNQMETK